MPGRHIGNLTASELKMGLSLKVGMDRTFEWPIEVKVPSDKLAGQHLRFRFNAEFKALPTDEARAKLDEADLARREGRASEAADLDKSMLRDALVGWKGLDEAFDDTAREEAFANPFILQGLMEGYRKAVTGEGVQARRIKN
jgi:hypothetical protein